METALLVVGIVVIVVVVAFNLKNFSVGTVAATASACSSVNLGKVLTFKNLIIFLIIILLLDVLVFEKSMTRHFIGKVFSEGYVSDPKDADSKAVMAPVSVFPKEKTVGVKISQDEWTIKFCPNVWDEKNLGWQKVAKLGKGKYLVTASGTYEQWFSDGKAGGYYKFVYPDGMKIAWIAPYQDKLPSPENGAGYLLGKIGNSVIPIGVEKEVDVSGEDDLFLSANLRQSETSYGHPSMNFKKNKGMIEVKIKRIG